MKVLAGLAAVLLLTGGAAHAADTYTFELLGKAAPDECFAGIGNPYPPGPPCAEGQAKVNQSYVWGMTKAGAHVWFGTGANVHCLTTGSNLGVAEPVVNEDFVCEYGESQVAKEHPTVTDQFGDVRVPQVWLYDSGTGDLTNRSADITGASDADARRLRSTLGLRSAGNLDGVVLFAGPSLTGTLNLFAFDAADQRFLGSRTLTQYGNARTFLVADGGLYLGVGLGRNGAEGGAVLRWTGNRRTPFRFDEVANLPAQAADLTFHAGRIHATTWTAANPTSDGELAGVWVSPPLPLGAGTARDWTQAWHAGQYEPDPLTRTTYGLGGVASYGGYVYWGTMHVPLKSTLVHQTAYPQETEEAQRNQVRLSQRTLSVWRGKDLGTPDQKIELLYGESALPVYAPDTATWSGVPTGWTAVYGKSGFGNTFNNYTWRMTVAGGRLYVATMDWSYLVQHVSETPPPTDPTGWGADLWAFPSPDTRAVPVTTTGAGNHLNYGIRNMVADDTGLYLGMANPMNLRTGPVGPRGGWELIKLAPATEQRR